MQIIQSHLGSQINPLGLRPPLADSHRFLLRKAHHSFIEPIATQSPLVTADKFLLARQPQSFIEPFTDWESGDNFASDTEFDLIDSEPVDLITTESRYYNNSEAIKANNSNILSHPSDIDPNNQTYPDLKISAKSKSVSKSSKSQKNNSKSQTKSTAKSRTKSQSKKATKSQTAKNVDLAVNDIPLQINSEENSLIPPPPLSSASNSEIHLLPDNEIFTENESAESSLIPQPPLSSASNSQIHLLPDNEIFTENESAENSLIPPPPLSSASNSQIHLLPDNEIFTENESAESSLIPQPPVSSASNSEIHLLPDNEIFTENESAESSLIPPPPLSSASNSEIHRHDNEIFTENESTENSLIPQPPVSSASNSEIHLLPDNEIFTENESAKSSLIPQPPVSSASNSEIHLLPDNEIFTENDINIDTHDVDDGNFSQNPLIETVKTSPLVQDTSTVVGNIPNDALQIIAESSSSLFTPTETTNKKPNPLTPLPKMEGGKFAASNLVSEKFSTLPEQSESSSIFTSENYATTVNTVPVLETITPGQQNTKLESSASEVTQIAPIEPTLSNVGETFILSNNLAENDEPVATEASPDVNILDIPVNQNSPQPEIAASQIPAIADNQSAALPRNLMPKNEVTPSAKAELSDTNNSFAEISTVGTDEILASRTNDAVTDNAIANNYGENPPLSLTEDTPKVFGNLIKDEQPVVSEFPSILPISESSKKVNTSDVVIQSLLATTTSAENSEVTTTNSPVVQPTIADIISNRNESPQSPENPPPTPQSLRGEEPLVLQGSVGLFDGEQLSENEISSSENPGVTTTDSTGIQSENREITTTDSPVVQPTIADVISNQTESPQHPETPSPTPPHIRGEALDGSVGFLDAETSSQEVEQNTVLEQLPAPQGYATGGQVTASSGESRTQIAPSDTVPAMLTPGEFVVNATDAQKNLHLLRQINSGAIPEKLILPSVETANIQAQPAKTSPPTPTKVDNFGETTVQRETDDINPSAESNSLTPSSLGEEIGKQRLSMLSSPQINTVESTTNTVNKASTHYSSPTLIFRKPNSPNHTNTHTPAQWSSVEELLHGSNDEFTFFNFGNAESNWQNSEFSPGSQTSTAPQIFTKRLSAPRGFVNGGEVTAPDISSDIQPITETIENPYLSQQEDNNDAQLEILAHEIYNRLRQRIEIERERHGISFGRLPW